MAQWENQKKSKALRVPPQTLETEKALLGALMIRPEGMLESSDVLSPDAFYAEKHRIIYRAMLALYTKNEPVDIESVRAKLQDGNHLDAVGGIEHLAELAYDEASEIDETLDKAEKRIYEVTSSPTLSKFTSLSESLKGACERLEPFHAHQDKK